MAENKKESLYDNIFEKLKFLLEISPDLIIIDFEKGLLNSLKKRFPDTEINGCLFHFGQSVWRRIQSLNLTTYYKSNALFKTAVKMLLNLVFVPKNKVMKEYKNILNFIEDNKIEKMHDFLLYFERTFVVYSEETCNNRLFSVDFWSSHDRGIFNHPRMTNLVEALHRILNKNMSIAHPNISKVIDVFQKEDEKARFQLVQAAYGIIVLPNRNMLKEELIRTVVSNYTFFLGLGFFEAIGRSYEWLLDD